jgi:glycosyltransferase involved in cell wall biosynthesis
VLRAIHQFTPMLSAGDAVGNQVRYLRRLFRGWGFQSEIYADRVDAGSAGQALPAQGLQRAGGQDTVVLIHHSFESCRLPLFRKLRARRVVAYHNVTPSRLFEGFEPQLAQACDAARAELRSLAPLAERAFAFSRFSAEELEAAGFDPVSVVPFAIDWASFDAPPDEARLAELGDGCANVLFVGRLVPNKAVDDVLRVFTAFQRLYARRSRLVVAGGVSWERPYGQWLAAVRATLGPERVVWMGRATQQELSACFATASVYLSMSRHEGFGVPLLEAMHRGVPVVAYGAAAVPETMGGAGVCTLSRDPLEVAKVLAVVAKDPGVRASVVEGQRARMTAQYPPRSEESLKKAFGVLWEGAPPARRPERAVRVSVVAPSYLRSPGGEEAHLAHRLVEALGGRCDVEILCVRQGPLPGPAPTARFPGVALRTFGADEPETGAWSTALLTAAASFPALSVEVACGRPRQTAAAHLVEREGDVARVVKLLERHLNPRPRWSLRHAS